MGSDTTLSLAVVFQGAASSLRARMSQDSQLGVVLRRTGCQRSGSPVSMAQLGLT